MKIKKNYMVVLIAVLFLSNLTSKSFGQYESEFNTVKLSDFKEISDFGYAVTANLYYGGQGDNSRGDGSYHFGFIWRKVLQSSTMSSKCKVDFRHNIPASGEDTSGEFKIDGEAGPESNLARFTYDKYMNAQVMNQSLFIFGEPQAKFNIYLDKDKDTPDPIIALFAGVGLGKLYPSGDYNRIGDFFKILEDNGLLKREINSNEIKLLMSIIKNRWESYKQTHTALKKLVELGILKEYPSDEIISLLTETIEKSQEYEESGSDTRFGIHFTFTTGETTYIGGGGDIDTDMPIRIAFAYRNPIEKGPYLITPWTTLFQEFSPKTTTYLNLGSEVTYQATARLKHFLKERFSYYAWEGDSSFSNNLEIGSSYEITSLLNASLVGTLDLREEQDAEFSIKLYLGIGMTGL